IVQPLSAADPGGAPAPSAGAVGAVGAVGADGAGLAAIPGAAAGNLEAAEAVEANLSPAQGPAPSRSASPSLVESITVSGQRVVDLDSGGENKTTFTNDLIEDLPIIGHRYQSLLVLAPGVQDANGDGNPNVM